MIYDLTQTTSLQPGNTGIWKLCLDSFDLSLLPLQLPANLIPAV